MASVPKDDLLGSERSGDDDDSMMLLEFGPPRKRARTLPHSLIAELEPSEYRTNAASNDAHTAALRYRSHSVPNTMISSPAIDQTLRQKKIKICNVDGCNKGARGGSGLCQRHGGGRRCSVPNCTRGAQGASDKCTSHGGGYRCKHFGCETGARGNSGYCFRHGRRRISKERDNNITRQVRAVAPKSEISFLPDTSSSTVSSTSTTIAFNQSVIGRNDETTPSLMASNSSTAVSNSESLNALVCAHCQNNQRNLNSRRMLYMLPCRHLIHTECAKALITQPHSLGFYCTACHAAVLSLAPFRQSSSPHPVVNVSHNHVEPHPLLMSHHNNTIEDTIPVVNNNTVPSDYWSTPEAEELLKLLPSDDEC